MEEAGKSCNIAKGGAKPLDDSEDDSEIDEDMFDACVAGEAEETELMIAAEKEKAANNEESEVDEEEDDDEEDDDEEDDDEEDGEENEEVVDCVLSMDDLKKMAEAETGKTDEIEDKMEEVDIMDTGSQDEIEAKVEATTVETTVKTRTRKAPQAKSSNSKKRKTK